MTEPLKNIINRPLLEHAASAMQHTWPPFDSDRFDQLVFDSAWEDRALKERLRHIASVLRLVLPPEYPEAQAVIAHTVQHLVQTHGEKLTFEYGFWTDFVAQFGLSNPEVSLGALETITQWTTAEYAIRPFLLHHQTLAYPRMHDWSSHPSPMVRRLSSEGFRPRLPWGMGLPALKKDPSPILPILEHLKQDPAETVRRSVANCLNDISKDHPALVLDTARRWMGQHIDTDWVVRHACRGLLKQGHPEALALFGFNAAQNHIVLRALQVGKQVLTGEDLPFEIAVHNQGAEAETLRLEYRIHYCKASGKTSGKTFHLREVRLLPGETLTVQRRQSFRDLTTRKHYPGAHVLEVLLNGVVAGRADFELR
jgi:3-methyladenine DNA glycosylase AlkC